MMIIGTHNLRNANLMLDKDFFFLIDFPAPCLGFNFICLEIAAVYLSLYLSIYLFISHLRFGLTNKNLLGQTLRCSLGILSLIAVMLDDRGCVRADVRGRR